MIQTFEAVIDEQGTVRLLQAVHLDAPRRALVTVLEDERRRFLDAVEAVDQLGVAETAADEIAPLCHHAEPRVRMYTVMARTVLGPRGPAEARELIALFDDPDESVEVRCASAACLVLFREQARNAVPSLSKAIVDYNHPMHVSAMTAFLQLGWEITGALPPPGNGSLRMNSGFRNSPPKPDATRREMGELLVREADRIEWHRVLREQISSRKGSS